MKIDRINPFDLAVLIAIFEFFALLIIGIIGIEKVLASGLLQTTVYAAMTGIITAILSLLIFNNSPLKIRFGKKTINNIPIIRFMLANGIFLAVMFFIQYLIADIKTFNIIWGNMVLGFVTNFLTAMVLLSVYNRQPYKFQIDTGKGLLVKSIAPLSAAVFVAMIEAFILPLMTILMTFSTNPAWYAISGLLSGLIGVYIATSIYNRFISKKLPITLTC